MLKGESRSYPIFFGSGSLPGEEMPLVQGSALCTVHRGIGEPVNLVTVTLRKQSCALRCMRRAGAGTRRVRARFSSVINRLDQECRPREFAGHVVFGR